MSRDETKEKIIRESIKRLEKRIAKIKEILSGNYLSEIIEGRREALSLIEKHRNDLHNKDFQKRIEELFAKEKELRKKFDYQNKNDRKLSEEQIDKEIELGDLKNELYWIEERKKTNRLEGK